MSSPDLNWIMLLENPYLSGKNITLELPQIPWKDQVTEIRAHIQLHITDLRPMINQWFTDRSIKALP